MDDDEIQSRGSWKKDKGKKRVAAVVAALLILAALLIGLWAFGSGGADAQPAAQAAISTLKLYLA